MCTDIVESTQRNAELGDAVMAKFWEEHDAASRALIRRWGGLEIARSDGFLVLFDQPPNALGFSAAYHNLLSALTPPMAARIGVHFGPLSVRANSPEDRALGALPFEVDGLTLPIAARLGGAAHSGQTLISSQAVQGAGLLPEEVCRLGHWQFKGAPEPMELFAAVGGGAVLQPPPRSAKAYRVVTTDHGWMPADEIEHQLPAERDPFVGRSATLVRLAHDLDQGARLVTLLGAGGIGKTRLALAYARRWLGEYPGGAWFCDLAPSRGLDGITHAVASGLNVVLGRMDPVRQIGAAVDARGVCLVIVDNFEQVAVHAQAVLTAWLEAAPQAKFIATSREVLGVAGEHVLRVEPMAAGEGIELFHRRAHAAGASASSKDGGVEVVTELVRLLDGLPLAIELAAARTPLMPPAMLLARMHERFDLLASKRGRDPRQATLRATLDWSWTLLTAEEQRALAQLSTFEGGLTIEAAEAVLESTAGSRTLAVVDVLQSLLDKSLLKKSTEHRLDMLVSVQQYAAEKLQEMSIVDEPLAVATERRHFAFFTGQQPIDASLFATAEIENLVAACRRAVARRNAVDAARALEVAWAGLRLRGPMTTALELAVDICDMRQVDPLTAARVARVCGSAHNELGQVDQALQQFERGIELLRGQEGHLLEGQLLRSLGDLHALAGRMDVSGENLEAALAIARRAGNVELECTVQNSMGSREESLGLLRDAATHYEQALQLARANGLRRWEAGSLGNLAQLQTTLGHHANAERLYSQAILIARELGDRRWEGNALCNLGLTLQALGRLDEARESLLAALQIARHLGQRRLEATSLCNLGIILQAMTDHAAARAAFEQAISVAKKLADRRAEGQFLGYLGILDLRTGKADRASESLTRSQDLLEEVSDRLSLALVLCYQTEMELRRGAFGAARRLFERATSIAKEHNFGEPSELTIALAQLSDTWGPQLTG